MTVAKAAPPERPPSEIVVERLVRSGATPKSEAVVLERALRTRDHETIHRVLGLMDERADAAVAVGDRETAAATRAGKAVVAETAGLARRAGRPTPAKAAGAAPAAAAPRGAEGLKVPSGQVARAAPAAVAAAAPRAHGPAVPAPPMATPFRPQGKVPPAADNPGAGAPLLAAPHVLSPSFRAQPLAPRPYTIAEGAVGLGNSYLAPARSSYPLRAGTSRASGAGPQRRDQRPVGERSFDVATPLPADGSDRRAKGSGLKQAGSRRGLVADDVPNTRFVDVGGDMLEPRRVTEQPPQDIGTLYAHGNAPVAGADGVLEADRFGTPLTAPIIIGRRTVDGNDAPLTRDQAIALAEGLTGQPVVFDGTLIDTDPQTGQETWRYGLLGARNGQVSGGHTEYDKTRTVALRIVINARTDEYEQRQTIIHEAAHALFDAIEADPALDQVLESLRPRLSQLWYQVNVGRPSDFGYDETNPDVLLREFLADFVRIYDFNADWMNEHYPDLVETLIPLINNDPEISRVVQFN